MSFNILELDVVRWAEARKIIPNSTPKAQAFKTLEEVGELIEAASELALLKAMSYDENSSIYKKCLEKYKDAVGDVTVTLINGCALADVQLVDCLQGSYNEIKHRTGTLMPNGIFVKDGK